jgi:hypothetical protein
LCDDDLEFDLENAKGAYEERLQLCQEQLELMSSNVKQQKSNNYLPDDSNKGNDVKALNVREEKQIPLDDPEMQQELKKIRSQLDEYENTIKKMKEELDQKNNELEKTTDEVSVLHKQLDNKQDQGTDDKSNSNATEKESSLKNENADKEVVTSSTDPLQNQNILLQQKIMKTEKEKGDLMTRLHRVEGENINLRIEQDMMKQDIVDLNKEKSSLKVELSTARIHFNYEREMNGDKADANDKNPSGIHHKNSTQNGNKNKNGYHDATDGSNLSNGKREKPQVDFDDAFVQELMDKIEILTKEKSDISHELLQEKSLKEESNRKFERLEQERKMQLYQSKQGKKDDKGDAISDIKTTESKNVTEDPLNGHASDLPPFISRS